MKKYLDIWTARKLGLDAEHLLTRERLDCYTAQKLQQTIRLAAENSVFYRDRLKQNAEVLKQILSLEMGDKHFDLAAFWELFEQLPFSTGQDLHERGEDFLCVRPNEISRIVTLPTGGSMGIPKRVYFTEKDQQLTVDFFENGMQLLADSRDKILILMPAERPGSIGTLLAQGLSNFGAGSIRYGLPKTNWAESLQETADLLDLIRREGVSGVVALPLHMKCLAELELRQRQAAEQQKSVREAIRLNSVLLSADYVPEDAVQLIEDVFNCHVYEHYGMTEMGLGCAVNCGQGSGYHIRELDIYLEIIDPDTGTVIRDDRPGEIVFTTLTREGMPFLRYRTGDHSRWILERCSCGSILKRLDKVEPRNVVKGYLRGDRK